MHPSREDFKSKLSISFDDDGELDPEKRSMNVNSLVFRSRVTKKLFFSYSAFDFNTRLGNCI